MLFINTLHGGHVFSGHKGSNLDNGLSNGQSLHVRGPGAIDSTHLGYDYILLAYLLLYFNSVTLPNQL